MNEMVMENNGIQGLAARKMSLREVFKNEKGLTLIELLAVIVIIAIIAAIAIPSIGSIMDKTRKNAHRSNAHMAIDAARLYMTNEGVTLNSTRTTIFISLAELHEKGYLQLVPTDPSNKTSTYAPGTPWTTAPVEADPGASFVKVTNQGTVAGAAATVANYQYSVNLVSTIASAVPYLTDIPESDIELAASVKE